MADNYDYKLVIYGNPKAQGRHRTYTKDRNGKTLKYARQVDPSETDKRNLQLVVQQQAPPKLLACPVCVDINFYFPRPKSHYRTGKYAGQLKENAPSYHTKKPDREPKNERYSNG